MNYQFNKTEIQRLNKDLKIRLQALPILKNKEAALRVEIKKHRATLKNLQVQMDEKSSVLEEIIGLYADPYLNFDKSMIEVSKIDIVSKKIAGIKIPSLQSVEFSVRPFSIFNAPAWLLDGIEIIKSFATLKIKIEQEQQAINILELARKKTTQKVNLYEKVQVPAFQEAIIKIKRFLEDLDNLDRAAQKIVKKKRAVII
ncbi:MAG: V-type ATP synthase subunit D [Oligoflexia bacterium]|nr:V-type ATP synthase subunit D [Oligoflexia bacterium]